VFRQESFVDRAALEQIPMHRQSDRQVSARPGCQMQIGLARERRRSRINHDELCAELACFTDIRHQVNP
jgi:hypothetical protein